MDWIMYILRGLPGSGKSTFVSLAAKTYVCSADHYYMVGDKYLFDRNVIGDAHKMCRFKADAACKANFPEVIIDNTNTTWKEVRPYVEIADKYGYKVIFVTPRTARCNDVDECFKRNVHGVPKEAIQAMKDRWQDNDAIMQQAIAEFPNVKTSLI